MHLKRIIEESVGDYKETSMLLVTPSCTWKCKGCQNKDLAKLPTVEVDDNDILALFSSNPFSKAIVIGGLEPLDCIEEIRAFIFSARKYFPIGERPPIIIYTGYEEEQLKKMGWESKLKYELIQYGNCHLKYGKYVENGSPYKNAVLGVKLASSNQHVMSFTRKQYE